MKNKFKNLLAAAILMAALPVASFAQNNKGGSGNNGSAPHDKVTLCHNGHSITISRSAYDAHMRNHNKDGAKLTCYDINDSRSKCAKQTTPPPPPPTNCPPKEEDPCGGILGCS